MLKHWKSVLHCNECTYWTGFVCWWHPGRRLLFYSMKLAVKSVVLAFLSCKKWDLGEKVLGFVASMLGGGKTSANTLCFPPSDLHNSETVSASARCNQIQLKSSTALFKYYTYLKSYSQWWMRHSHPLT